MPEASLTCGLDLGGTKLLGLVVDATNPGEVLAEERVPTPHDGIDTLVATMRQMVATLDERVRSSHGGLTAVGLGAPGLVDRDGVLRSGANLPGIIDQPLAATLTEATGFPTVAENDATCATWGEHECGAARGHPNVIMCTLGTGIGAGVVAGGTVLRGANGFAGEPGHMVVDPTGPACPCGRHGCWERYGSGSGLGRLAREAANAGHIPQVVDLAGGDPEDVRGEHVTSAAGDGDAGAVEVLANFGWWLALGIANLVNLFDTELVVIGGGLADAGSLVIDPTREAFGEMLLGWEHRPSVDIVRAELGERAGAVGAALLAAARVD